MTKKLKKMNWKKDRMKVFLVWQIEHPLINLRAICAIKEKAELYKMVLIRDEKSKNIYIEETLTNHLFAYKMINTVYNSIVKTYHQGD